MIAATEEQIERFGGLFQPVDELLVMHQGAVLDHGCQFDLRFNVSRGEVEDQEALHTRATHDQHRAVGDPPGPFGGVVLRNGPADDDPSAQSDVGQRGVENLAAHVVEVQVNAVGTGRTQTPREVLFAVVETLIKTVLFDDLGAFLRTAGDADHLFGPAGPGNLADHRSRSSACARDDDDVARLELTDVQQAEKGREASGTEHVHDGGHVESQTLGDDREPVLFAGNHPFLPVRHARDDVANLVVRRGGFHDHSHPARTDDVTDANGRHVARRVVHPGANGRVDGQRPYPDQRLVRPADRSGHLD